MSREVMEDALDQMEEGERQDILEAVLGKHIEQELSSESMKLIIERAVASIATARNKLEEMDPEDPKAIRETQNEIQLGRKIISFLSEAIINGVQAEERIQLRDQTR